MKNFLAFLAPVALFIGAIIVVPRLVATPATDTPIHATDVFFDGVNHGDYRETCAAWQAGRKHMGQCEAYLAYQEALSGPITYRVVPHSAKEWREGKVSVASVKVRGGYGYVLTVRLVKTRAHGWLVVAAH